METTLQTLIQQQSEINVLFQQLQRAIQQQQNTISLLTQSLPVNPTSVDKNWLPLILYGNIKESNNVFIYHFCRKETQYPYNSPETRNAAYQQVTQHQIKESLNNGRNNRYYIDNNVIYLELRDGTFALIDISDLPYIQNRTWYPHKGHVTTRMDNKRLKMCEVLTGNSEIYFENGSTLDNRRSNLMNTSSIPSGFFKLTLDQWNYLKLAANQSEESLTNAVNYLNALVNDVPEFPMVIYTNQEIQEDYLKILNSSTTGLVTCGIGGKISRHFMKDAMFHSRKEGYPTIYEVWDSPQLRERLFLAMLRLNMNDFNATNLIRAFGLSYYKVGNFPAVAARNLYDYHLSLNLPDSNLRVLDFCSGFGGRLVGFWASKKCSHYVGIDPNPRLIQPYLNLINWLKSHSQNSKFVTMISDCAEEVTYQNIKYEDGSSVQDHPFDIIFTSPPYFNLETYGIENTQSSIRYPEISLWRDQFLFKTLCKVVQVLKPGGILAINIKDSPQWNLPLSQQMVTFIQSLGLVPRETLQLKLSKRPGATSESTEPIFVFTKI